jgi:hypothetical protein
VYFKSLPRFKCRIWGGCPMDGWGRGARDDMVSEDAMLARFCVLQDFDC